VATGLARGGAEAQLFRAAVGLRARGTAVHVVCMLSSDYYGARLEEHGIPVTCLNASRRTNPFTILTRFVQCLKTIAPAALAGFDYPGTMLARAGGAVARVPVVVSSIRSENLGGVLRRLALTWTDRLATVTTTNSHAVARQLVACGATSSTRVRVIPNGLDLRAVGPHLRRERDVLRRSLGVAEDEFLWLAAGRLEEPKDYPNLLAAMTLLRRRHTGVKLAIAGQGPLLQAMRDQAAASQIEHIVTFLGLRDDVTTCMAAADALVLSSAWESLPNVVIESLAVGTPVVCTDVGGVREIVHHGRSGFVVPARNTEALTAAMSALMQCSENRRREMGAAGRTHVEAHFDLDRILASWFGLFDQLLGSAA
jgi:glycosyltransferase involved in cell wall biosynthesis